MSTQQNLVTVGQVRSMQQSGKVEFVTRDVLIQPDRYTFANLDELTAYVGETFGGQPAGQGLRGSMTRKGIYSRRAADGTDAVTFGDPVLDAVSSATGTIVIGTQTIDLVEDLGSPESVNAAGGGAVASASGLVKTGIVNGAERWATDDGSLVEYRMGAGTLSFHAWNRRRTFPPYWSAGAKIFIKGTNADFEFADIRSYYYMSVTSPCEPSVDGDSDSDDSYLEEYEWGVNAQRPERVASLCRARWHHSQFADVVTAGEGCLRYLNDSWPTGFPPEWTPISTGLELTGLWTDGSAQRAVISRKPRSLTIDMSDFDRSAAQGSIVDFATIEVTFPDDATYTGTLESPNRIRWSNGTTWTKVVSTVLDLNGSWTAGTARRAIISEGRTNLTIDMSDFDRPAARGSIIDSSTIEVTFPGDTTHTGSLQSPNRIRWSNGTMWTKV